MTEYRNDLGGSYVIDPKSGEIICIERTIEPGVEVFDDADAPAAPSIEPVDPEPAAGEPERPATDMTASE